MASQSTSDIESSDVDSSESHGSSQTGRGGVRGRDRGKGRGRGRGERGRRSRGRGEKSRSRSRRSRGESAGRASSSRRGGRGRGRGDGILRSDRERLEELWSQRKQQMEEVVQQMDEESLRGLVLRLVDREPGLVFDLCQAAGGNQPDPSQPVPADVPEWCRCGHCRDMGSDIDNVCCGCLPQNCISTRDEMDRLVLDPQVLALGHQYYRAVLARRGQRVDEVNKRNRHCAYRHFTLWRWGRLGAGVRRVVPSCVVTKIREVYPSTTGTYTGFRPGRFY